MCCDLEFMRVLLLMEIWSSLFPVPKARPQDILVLTSSSHALNLKFLPFYGSPPHHATWVYILRFETTFLKLLTQFT